MRYNVTELDKMLMLQETLDYRYRLYVLNKENQIMDELTGVSSIGSYNIDSNSTTRRTASFILELDNTYHSKHIEEKIELWIGYDFYMQIGINNIRTDEFVWYDCGYYTITSTNTTYDAVNNTLSTDLSDWFTKMDGTRNGQIGGAPTILIPNLDEDGNKITLKQATIGVLKDNGIKNYIVQDIGEFYGMQENNDNYLSYRNDNPNWNQLPYDLEYNSGCRVSDILIDIRDLYPNCEMYWDIFHNFCFNMIPSCENDPVQMDNTFLQKIIYDSNTENVTYDVPSIKNITEIFGHMYDVDRFCENCTMSSNVYTLTLDNYGEYGKGDIISFIPNANNLPYTRIRINSLPSIPLYKEYTSEYIEADMIENGRAACIKISRSTDGEYIAYYLGQYQPHALCVLTNNGNDATYTKEYFSAKYNCDIRNIVFRVESGNPFAIQRLGEVLDTKSGEEFDNIYSDSVALSNAVYYNQKASTFNDIVTLTTKMIPWLDVNIKVSYRKQQESVEHEYIIKSISNDLGGMSTSIVMHRFYPLYFD